MKVFSDELQRLGVPATPGDRLEYVIVKTREETATGKSVLLGYKMRLPETYLDRLESDEPEMIDAMYYIEKVATNCIEQLWQVGYRRELAEIEQNNRIQDANNILGELKSWGYTLQVNAYLSHTGYDPIKAVELLLDSPDLGRMTVEARKRHVTGRGIFDTRLSRKPIQTMSKSIPIGRFPDVIRSFCTQEDERNQWLSELECRPDLTAIAK
jgi:hypothetical protein